MEQVNKPISIPVSLFGLPSLLHVFCAATTQLWEQVAAVLKQLCVS